ncbi:MAG: YqiA/YcfP family alpha/beta fold hydrolase [Ghiorsea sp.]
MTTNQISSPETCVYLVHGFASAPKYPSDKADALVEAFGLPVKQIAYDSAAGFVDNMAQLKGQVDVPPHLFVGTSLGAFYANKLAEFFYPENAAASVMLNPCHNPAEMLHGVLGEHINFATDETFMFTEQALASYQGVSLIDGSIAMPRTMLLNMDDERIDSAKTVALYQDKLHIASFAQGGHRFENIGSDEVLNVLSDIQQ